MAAEQLKHEWRNHLPALIAGAGKPAALRFVEFFHRQYPQQEHTCRRWTCGRSFPALLRRAGNSPYSGRYSLCMSPFTSSSWHHVAVGQATSRLHPHAIRLAGCRPGRCLESCACSAWFASFGKPKLDAAGRHGCFAQRRSELQRD